MFLIHSHLHYHLCSSLECHCLRNENNVLYQWWDFTRMSKGTKNHVLNKIIFLKISKRRPSVTSLDPTPQISKCNLKKLVNKICELKKLQMVIFLQNYVAKQHIEKKFFKQFFVFILCKRESLSSINLFIFFIDFFVTNHCFIFQK